MTGTVGVNFSKNFTPTLYWPKLYAMYSLYSFNVHEYQRTLECVNIFFSRFQGDGTSNRVVILFRLINLRLVMESGAERRFVRWEQRERLVGQHWCYVQLKRIDAPDTGHLPLVLHALGTWLKGKERFQVTLVSCIFNPLIPLSYRVGPSWMFH